MHLGVTFVKSMFIMDTMHTMHLAGIDMNLLVVLDALLLERSVTRAAARVGLSQPALSHALARLRELLADPLFVRTPRGMEPTARALALAPVLTRALADLQRAIAEPPRFEPATSTRKFTISTSDYMELVLLPTLVARVARAAPHVALQSGVRKGLEGLADGSIDLALRPLPRESRPGLHHEEIFRDRFVCLLRRGHPLTRGRLTLERYCAASHIMIAPGGTNTGGVVDEQLAQLGKQRRVALVLQQFLIAPHVVAASDLVVTVAETMALTFTRLLPLQILTPPLALPSLTMTQLWHERQAHDPALQWLRDELRATAKSLAPGRKAAQKNSGAAGLKRSAK